MQEYSVFQLLKTKTNDIDEYINKSPDFVKVPTLFLDRVEKFVEVLKGRGYKDINDLRDFVAGKLSSKEYDFGQKLYINLLNFLVFEKLIASIQYQRKLLGSVGSVLRGTGSLMRGGNPPKFCNLLEAIKDFENKSTVGKLFGNLFRGAGETFSGESETFERVIKRTVEGVNPFKKRDRIDKESRAEDPEILIIVCHSLFRLFEGKEIGGAYFLIYLYSYVFNKFSTMTSSEDPDFYDKVFYKGLGNYVFYDLLSLHTKKEIFSNYKSARNELVKFVENCLIISKQFNSMFRFDSIKVDSKLLTLQELNRLKNLDPELSKLDDSEIKTELLVEVKIKELRTQRKREVFASVFNDNVTQKRREYVMNYPKFEDSKEEEVEGEENSGNSITSKSVLKKHISASIDQNLGDTQIGENFTKYDDDDDSDEDKEIRRISKSSENLGITESKDLENLEKHFREYMNIINKKKKMSILSEFMDNEDSNLTVNNSNTDSLEPIVISQSQNSNTVNVTTTESEIVSESNSLSASRISDELDTREDSLNPSDIENELNDLSTAFDFSPKDYVNEMNSQSNKKVESPILSELDEDEKTGILEDLKQGIRDSNSNSNENNYSFNVDENNSSFFNEVKSNRRKDSDESNVEQDSKSIKNTQFLSLENSDSENNSLMQFYQVQENEGEGGTVGQFDDLLKLHGDKDNSSQENN